MPAFVDWDSLLFGTPRETRPRKKVAPYPQPDASQPETPQLPDVQDVQVESLAPEGAVPESADAEITLPENEIHEVASIAPEPTCTTTPEFRLIDQAIPWDVVPENTNDRLVVGAIFLGTVLLWFWFGRKRKSHATSRHSVANYQDSSLDDIRRDFAHQTEAIGKQFNQALKEQIDVVREQFQKVLDSQTELIEDNVRKTFNKRVETLETRIKLDQEALNNIHRVLSERMETFEGYVKTIDSKHLDQEASNIAQRSLGQRLDLVEDNFRQMDAKARAYSQRIEAIDDSVRVIDSRAKALSQRVEAAEDNMNTTDGQVTLLSHDVNRGSSIIEKLQRQVKLLPDAEKLKSLSHTWEVKVKKLETELEETRKTLDEHLAEPPPTLTWSHIESVEIEPTGLLYNKPHHPHSYDDLVVSPSSSSARSHSTAGSYPRSFSTSSTSPATHSPITPSQRRLETAGFRETTFSSRQKLFAFRGDSWPS